MMCRVPSKVLSFVMSHVAPVLAESTPVALAPFPLIEPYVEVLVQNRLITNDPKQKKKKKKKTRKKAQAARKGMNSRMNE